MWLFFFHEPKLNRVIESSIITSQVQILDYRYPDFNRLDAAKRFSYEYRQRNLQFLHSIRLDGSGSAVLKMPRPAPSIFECRIVGSLLL